MNFSCRVESTISIRIYLYVDVVERQQSSQRHRVQWLRSTFYYGKRANYTGDVKPVYKIDILVHAQVYLLVVSVHQQTECLSHTGLRNNQLDLSNVGPFDILARVKCDAFTYGIPLEFIPITRVTKSPTFFRIDSPIS